MAGIGHNSEQFDLADEPVGDWIALSRKVREHPVVGVSQPVKPADPKQGSHSRFEAWFDLLCLAQWKPSRINNKGEIMTLEVGQLMGARAYLAARWNWTEKTVRGFLSTLEGEGMIARGSENSEEKGQQDGQRRANKCNVITICNYSRYQMLQDAITSYVGQAKGPAKGQHGASEGPAKGHNLTRKTLKQLDTPLPPKGGAVGRKKDPFTKAEILASDEALRMWNDTAMRLGLTICNSYSPQRRSRMIRRLGDVGGLDQLKLALSAIELVPFLMGRVAPRDGEKPFKMDIDHLMQTNGNLGDVLSKLIDKAGDAPALVGPDGKPWGWWRGQEDAIRKLPITYWRQLDADCKPNGTWPWWIMGAPPGHEECLMPAELVAEFGYENKYRGQIHHV
mgnify:CR=1 FL=1